MTLSFSPWAEPGSEPYVTAVSHWNGSVTLVCVSTNWLFPPAMEWRDGMGMILQNVSTMINSDKTSFNIQQNVTVEEQHGDNDTCTVSKKNYRTEKTFMVDRKCQTMPMSISKILWPHK